MYERPQHRQEEDVISCEEAELLVEYNACDNHLERDIIRRQLRQVEADRKRLQEQAETLQLLPETWGAIYGAVRGYLALFSGVRREHLLSDPHSAYFDWPRQAHQAVRWVEREAATNRELYHCAHLLTERRRRKEYAAPLAAVYVDLDSTPRASAQVPPPSVSVQTSPGHWQHYWGLTHPVAPAMGEALNRHLAYLLNADASGWDLTQLLRIPGTVNHKYPEEPLVRLLDVRNTRYPPAVLRDLDAEYPLFRPPTPTEPRPAAPAMAVPTPPLAELTQNLTRRAQRILAGKEPVCRADGDIDRSASLLQIARVLAGAGINGDQLVAALAERDASLGWRKYSDRDDAAAQYRRIATVVERTKNHR